MLKDKIFEAKQALSALNSTIKDQGTQAISNEELLALGKELYESVLGNTGLEVETFNFVSSLWEVYSVRGDLKTAVLFYEKVNFDFEGL